MLDMELELINKASLPACRLSVYTRLLTRTQRPGEIALIILGLKYTVETAGNRTVVANKEWQPMDIIGEVYLPK